MEDVLNHLILTKILSFHSIRLLRCWWLMLETKCVGDDRDRQHLKGAKIEILSPMSKNNEQPGNRHIPCHQYHCRQSVAFNLVCPSKYCYSDVGDYFSDVGDSIFQYQCYQNQLIEWIPFCNSSAELVWPSEQRMRPRNVNKVNSIKNGDNNT